MNDSLELSITENNHNETFASYSSLFDKAKHNFSTSSEISFVKDDLSSIDHNQTFTKDFSTTMIDNSATEESAKFNPFLLLFLQDDKQPIDQIGTNISVDSKQFNNDEITRCASLRQSLLDQKPVIFDHQRHSKRDSFKNPRTNQSSDDDQAFEKFLQEHRTTAKPVENEEKSPIQERRKKRNSLKDFIRDSSSSAEEEEEEQDPSEFYPKVNRLIDKDSSWRKVDDESSDQSGEASSSSSESDHRSITKKKNLKISVTFLESLSNYVPLEDKHCDAKQYFLRTGFKNKKKRQELAEKLFSMYDEDVFSSELSNKVTLIWSGRLTATAGHCTTRRSTQTATVTLSHKVCDSPERCRDTLLHEMCHAAVSLIDGVMNEGHGPLWRKWTRKAERCYPYLPAISVKHTYDITYKFIYRCIQCQYEVYRHSKSLDIEKDLCGKCLGKFQLLLNDNKKSEEQTPKRTLTKYNLFIKEHFQTTKQAQPHLSTPQLMKHLSQEYRKKMQQQNDLDLPDLEKLNI